VLVHAFLIDPAMSGLNPPPALADNMVMKRIAMLIVAAATLGLAACGSSGPAAAPPVTTAKPIPSTTTTTIAERKNVGTGDYGATSNLRDALTAALVSYTDNSSYSLTDITELTSIEPTLTFQASKSTAANEISVPATPEPQVWWATVRSDSGRCFGVEDDAMVGTTFAGGATRLETCQAPASDPHWSDTGW
jgi:predicted small lipoprotein YifL